MQRLLYISTTRTPISQGRIDEILRVSRRNNLRDGITGLLIVGGRRFLQALEGPEPAVSRTFDRIQRDPGHFAVVRLDCQPIETRAFGAWAMGYHAGGHTDATHPATAIAMLIAPIADKTLHGYFKGFADLHMKAA